jgi:cytochrome P450
MAYADLAEPVLAGPTPPARPPSFLKALSMAANDQLAMFPQAAYEQPIFEMNAFGRFILVNDPAAIKAVLLDRVENYPKHPQEQEALGDLFGEGILTSAGAKWRSHRRIMAPAFDLRSLRAYAPQMAQTTEAWMAGWAALPDGSAVEAQAAMTDLTLRIIAGTVFSGDVGRMTDMVGRTFAEAGEKLDFGLIDILPVLGPWRRRERRKAIHAVFADLDAEIARLVASRAARRDEGQADLLSRLVDARDPDTGLGMTAAEVRDEVVTIFVAGHETTAVAMTWIWYLLAQHPTEEAWLHAELDAVLSGRTPTYEDLARLPYTRWVIEEAMRLYPPAPGLSTRVALADDTLAGTAVPKGAMVGIMPWVLHRHRDLWDQPLRFDPERFSPESSAGRHRYAYLPFGGGPRVCIGMAMAMNEATIILATLAQRFRLRLAPGAVIEPHARITLRPRRGMPMLLERR